MGSSQQREAANWLATIASHHTGRLLVHTQCVLLSHAIVRRGTYSTDNFQAQAQCRDMIAGAGEATKRHDIVEAEVNGSTASNGRSGSKIVEAAGGSNFASGRLMVTRGQFIELLQAVDDLPQLMIENWFDALALRFAHVAPPPAELTLDARRFLAGAGKQQS